MRWLKLRMRLAEILGMPGMPGMPDVCEVAN